MLQLFRAFGPGERIATGVIVCNEPLEEFSQVLFGMLYAVCQTLLAQNAEESFYEVDPRGVGGNVMKLDARMAAEPAARCFILVDVQIIHYYMKLAMGIGAQ